MGDIFLIALCSIPALGPVTIRRLMRAFGSAERVFHAKRADLLRVEGISEKRAESIRVFDRFKSLDEDISRLSGQGVALLFHGSGDYPEALAELGEDAPPVLYAKGSVRKEDRFAVAVVGSRGATVHGKFVTEKIAAELGGMGFTIVSGLARGIDASAHRGAMSAGGRSIGVLGSGIDVPYPPENRDLLEKTMASGAVLSEFPPGTPPYQSNFPRRNRLISGLSLGVLVVEAAAKSGSLITARHALEQGKEVFSIPGNISSAVSRGTNELIKQGARMVTGAADIVEELAPQLKGFIKSRRKTADAALTAEERRLCDIMGAEPCHIDVLARESGMPASTALALLLSLELKGIVKQTEGKRFCLA
jgi:DNA processing protein